jgi:hypothetical protein
MSSSYDRRAEAIQANTKAIQDASLDRWIAEQEAQRRADAQAAERAEHQRQTDERRLQHLQDAALTDRFRTFIDEQCVEDPSLADTPEVLDERWDQRMKEQRASLSLDFRTMQARTAQEYQQARQLLDFEQNALQRIRPKVAPSFMFVLLAVVPGLMFLLAASKSVLAAVLGVVILGGLGFWHERRYRKALSTEPLLASTDANVLDHLLVASKALPVAAIAAVYAWDAHGPVPGHLFALIVTLVFALPALLMMEGMGPEWADLNERITECEKTYQDRLSLDEERWQEQHLLTTRPGESTWAVTPFTG